MTLPSGDPRRLPNGPYDVDELQLLEEAFTAVSNRPEILSEMEGLPEPPNLAEAVMAQRRVILLNASTHLKHTRQLSDRLHLLLIASDSTGASGIKEFVDTAAGLRDLVRAIDEAHTETAQSGTSSSDHLRELLHEAQMRRSIAEEKLEKGLGAAMKTALRLVTSPLEKPESYDDLSVALSEERGQLLIVLSQIETLARNALQRQIPRAGEQPEFRALEEQWKSSRQEIARTLESAVLSQILTTLNKAMAEYYDTLMTIRSLEGLQETLTKERIVKTPAFDDLEAMIRQRREGSFGIAGPRGVGKSTLIKFFTDDEPLGLDEDDLRSLHKPRLGVEVSAPVKYEPREFVLHLYAKICRKLAGPDADRDLESGWTRGPGRVVNPLVPLSLAVVGSVTAVGGIALLVQAILRFTAPTLSLTYLGAALIGVAAILLTCFMVTVLPALRLVTPVSGWRAPLWPFMERVRRSDSGRLTRIALRYCLAFGFSAATGLSLLTATGQRWPGTWYLVGGAGALAVGLSLLWIAKQLAYFPRSPSKGFPPSLTPDFPLHSPDGRLSEHALDRLRRIHYQQTFTSERSMVARVGGSRQLPVGVDAGAKQGATWAERVKTYPEIVQELKDFLERVAQRYQLIIAIDELDKIQTAESVEPFLNDIKGIFGADGCFYLVSVSEDAAASFERRGTPFRDVFDSSFDDVVSLERLSLPEAREILYGLLLGWTEPFVDLCFVLSGGLPRELHRSARTLVGRLDAGSKIDLGQALPDLLQHEGKARLQAVRHTLMSDPFDVTGLDLLAQLDGLEPDQATADLFRQWSDRLRSWAISRGGPTSDPSRLPRAVRLSWELVAFMTFGATLLDFFAPELIPARLKEARGPLAGPKSLSRLAAARNTLSANPGTSIACTTGFRVAWQL
ncbi:hypothetical protein XF35_38015 [Streptomyces platensis subsp. clarensis]|nr:hypothetical protein [Streptomyces platensis subsp. clarensis]